MIVDSVLFSPLSRGGLGNGSFSFCKQLWQCIEALSHFIIQLWVQGIFAPIMVNKSDLRLLISHSDWLDDGLNIMFIIQRCWNWHEPIDLFCFAFFATASYFKIIHRADKMAQWIKVFALRLRDLSLVHRTQWKEKGENWLHKAVLWPPHVCPHGKHTHDNT